MVQYRDITPLPPTQHSTDTLQLQLNSQGEKSTKLSTYGVDHHCTSPSPILMFLHFPSLAAAHTNTRTHQPTDPPQYLPAVCSTPLSPFRFPSHPPFRTQHSTSTSTHEEKPSQAKFKLHRQSKHRTKQSPLCTIVMVSFHIHTEASQSIKKKKPKAYRGAREGSRRLFLVVSSFSVQDFLIVYSRFEVSLVALGGRKRRLRYTRDTSSKGLLRDAGAIRYVSLGEVDRNRQEVRIVCGIGQSRGMERRVEERVADTLS